MLVWMARTHRVDSHRQVVRGLTIGALLTAGVFTLVEERLLVSMLWE